MIFLEDLSISISPLTHCDIILIQTYYLVSKVISLAERQSDTFFEYQLDFIVAQKQFDIP